MDQQLLTLYKVGGTGRANLSGLATPGVEFYTGERDDEGVITLRPVKIVSASTKQASTPDAEDEDTQEE